MTGGWTELRLEHLAPQSREQVIAALVDAGAPAVQELDTSVVTHVPDTTDLAALRTALRKADPGADLHTAPVGEIDWAARWPVGVGVQRLGPIAVAPPWRAAEIAGAACPVVIDPGTAFGTGEHETTRGVLHLLPTVIRTDDLVMDVGTGSGILAIAAALLGARRVAAIESDPQAIGNAESNVAANGVADRVTVLDGDARVIVPLLVPPRPNVILANIVSSVIVDLLPTFRDALAPGGRVVVSGILVEERDAACAELARTGWMVDTEYAEGAWWSSVIARR